MNKEEKLAYLDKLVEPQGNESGMSVAPLLRGMIEDAGDQVEVDDAIEAAKEAKETAEAAEAAATAAGTAAQEANTAAGNAQTAADNAQKIADEALQAANDAKQAAADSYVTGSPFSISAQSTSEQVNEFLGGFDNIAQAIDDGKKIYYHYTPRYSTDETQSTLPYLATEHGREDDNTVRLCYVVREFYFYQIKITKQDDGTLVCLKSETEFSTTFPDDVPQDATSHNLVGIPAGTDVTQDIIYLYDSIDNFIRLMNGKVPIYVSIGGGDYGNYQTLVGHINPGNVYEEGDEMVFIHYKSDKTSPIFDRIQGLKIDREAGTVTAVDCPQPSNVQLSDTSPSSDASTASAGTSKTAARADHVHPFAAGDIQNPKSMQGVDLDTILEPGYYEGVPAAKEGNPTVSDFASMVVMKGRSAEMLYQILFADGSKPEFRIRPSVGAGWQSWSPLAETDLTGTAVKPTLLQSGDLNTIKSPGIYTLPSYSGLTNAPALPSGTNAYVSTLLVESIDSSGNVKQTLSIVASNGVYVYSRISDTSFNDWRGGAVGGGISYVYEIATLDPYDGNGSEDAGGTVVINTPYKENQIIEVAMNTTGLGTGKSLTFRVLRSTETFGSMTVTVPPVDTFDDKGSIHFTVADLNPTTGNNPVLLSWWFSLDNA